MGILLLYLTLLVLTVPASPLSDASHNSCSSKFKAERHPHLNSSALHLTLHHHRSPCSLASPASSSLPFSTILSYDAARVKSLAARLTKPTTVRASSSSPLLRPSAVTVPLSGGSSVGIGNYITRIDLGTPAKSYVVVLDTGSSLSWVQCAPCRVYCHSQSGTLFDPTASATYRSVSCSATECGALEAATLNPPACSSSDVCIYEASYGDSSFSVGYLATDALSLGGNRILPRFVFGCGQDNEGLFGRSAGLIGLARNRLSLLSQVAPMTGNAFTYCLPSTSSAGYLSIGSYNPAKFAFTPLVSSSLDPSLYFLQLSAIKVAGSEIPVSASAYASTPTIIDSGTVITRLPEAVYDALSGAVVGALKGSRQAPAYSILDTCFVGSLRGIAVPAVEIVFRGGAALRLPPKNVMIDVDDSTTCLAFAPSRRVAIIGNTQHQTFSVAYDVGSSRIGFAAAGCS